MPKFQKMFEVMEVRRVKVFIHWSVILISAVILCGAIEDPLLAFTVLACYYGVILLHECGHLVAAQRKGCTVFSVDLYPIWGLTHFSEPYSRRDRCVIAWGGVVAQAIVGLPMIAVVEIFGYTRFAPVNAILAIFGFFSLSVAVFNLIPVPPLDGATALRLLPALFQRAPASRNVRHSGWRSWR